MAKVLITGGTGLIGKYLCKELLDKGYEPILLSRTKQNRGSIPVLTWDYISQKPNNNALSNVQYVIHLAGANIGDKRWTHKRKKQIIDSRVKTGELLYNTLVEQGVKIKAFISASAVGYYGAITTSKIYNENDAPSNDFISNVCVNWEATANKFKSVADRVVILRTGIVLTNQGGILEKLKKTLMLRVGVIMGRGNQYLPWIHINDLCNQYIRAIDDTEMNGVYNAVAPEHVTYKAFNDHLARELKNTILNIHIPNILLKLLVGKMADILLYGSRVSSNKIINSGFQFKFPTLKSALSNLVNKNVK